MSYKEMTDKIQRYMDEKGKYEKACLNLLSQRQILARLMKIFLSEYENCSIDEIIEKYIIGTAQFGTIPSISGKLLWIDEDLKMPDILCQILNPSTNKQMALIINVEPDNNDYIIHDELILRGFKYISEILSFGYQREVTGTEDHDINKIYMIGICVDMPSSEANIVREFNLAQKYLDMYPDVELVPDDVLSVIICYVAGAENENYDEDFRLLDVLLSLKISEREKLEILKNDYGIQISEAIKSNLLKIHDLNESTFAKEQAPIITGRLKSVFDEIRAEGYIEGFSEMFIETRWKSHLLYMEALMERLGIDGNKAAKLMGIPEEKQEMYIKGLKQLKEYLN